MRTRPGATRATPSRWAEALWIALYENEELDPPTWVGAGAGLATRPIARVSLAAGDEPMAAGGVPPASPPSPPATEPASTGDASDEPLTIAVAKSRLARTLGIHPTSIKITVEA